MTLLHSMHVHVVFFLLLLLPIFVVSDLEPCRHPSVSSLPFCNQSLSPLERVNDLISRLTLEEKVGQMMNNTAPIERFHIDSYHWWSESLHGIFAFCTKDGRCPTSYPLPIGMAATFNVKLIQTMASQISTEGRRLFVDNQFNSDNRHFRWIGLNFWAPNINLLRDPRWGRAMETPGEDPYLNGQYAVYYVKGMQEGEDPRYLKTVATLKHFVAYSLEHWHNYSRFDFNAVVSDEDLVQSYLPAFEAGIKEGRAKGVMCSFNAMGGVPSCANSFLMQTILRDEWDWDGHVVSDCSAILCVYLRHHYKPTPEEAVSVSLTAGTDLDCGGFYRFLPAAIEKGLLREGLVNKALARLLVARFKLGMFDPWDQQPYMQYPPEEVGHANHVATAHRAALESIVLLKNAGKSLPIDPNNIKRIAILGPHFNSTDALCGNYHADLPTVTSPLEGIQHALKATDVHVSRMKGCDFNSNNTKDFSRAVTIAQESDLAILFMGIDPFVENEGLDRTDIGLPGVQEYFVDTIANVQNKTVLILLNGGPVDVSAAKENPNVVAILEAFYPCMKGGEAIADVLFGKYNPSGRLPYTIYKKDYVDQISMADMSMTDPPGRTYRFFTGDVVYPFGYGLSYTTFGYNLVQAIQEDVTGERGRRILKSHYRVRVSNTGAVAGDTSVLAFLSFEGSSSDHSCPRSQLFGFKKIYLAPGESKEVFFSATPGDLKCYQRITKELDSPAGAYTAQIGDARHSFHYNKDEEKAQS